MLNWNALVKCYIMSYDSFKPRLSYSTLSLLTSFKLDLSCKYLIEFPYLLETYKACYSKTTSIRQPTQLYLQALPSFTYIPNALGRHDSYHHTSCAGTLAARLSPGQVERCILLLVRRLQLQVIPQHWRRFRCIVHKDRVRRRVNRDEGPRGHWFRVQGVHEL
jgi:hypothetical protein